MGVIDIFSIFVFQNLKAGIQRIVSKTRIVFLTFA